MIEEEPEIPKETEPKSPKDEILEQIKQMKLEQPKPTKEEEEEKKLSKMGFFEKNQKPLFFLLFVTSIANAFCFIAILL